MSETPKPSTYDVREYGAEGPANPPAISRLYRCVCCWLLYGAQFHEIAPASPRCTACGGKVEPVMLASVAP